MSIVVSQEFLTSKDDRSGALFFSSQNFLHEALIYLFLQGIDKFNQGEI